VSNQDKEQSNLQTYDPNSAEGTDTQVPHEALEYLHPSLRESFVALPPAGIQLTQSQLEAVFAGDLRALRELARLAYKSGEDASE
jgi:hypothetical protein